MPPRAASRQQASQSRLPPNESESTRPSPNTRTHGKSKGRGRPPKRRRSSTQPTVTSVFNPVNLPKTCRDLWQWPVTSWFFGDVTLADLNLASDSPFLTVPDGAVTDLPPPTHYRLQWLHQDASWLVNQTPQPLPQSPEQIFQARNKDGNACTRPSPFLNPDEHFGHSPRKPGRRRARARTSATDAEDSSRSQKRRYASSSPNPDEGILRHEQIEQAHNEDGVGTLCAPGLFQTAFDPNNPLGAYMRPAQCSPHPGVMSSGVDSNNVFAAALGTQSPSPVGTANTRDSKIAVLSNVAAQSHLSLSDSSQPDVPPSRKSVNLEFVSKKEPRVIAKVQYSITDAFSREGCSDCSGPDSVNCFVEGVDLNFRTADYEDCAMFDDEETVDELGEDIRKVIDQLRKVRDNSREVRFIAEAAAASALREQAEMDEIVAEEKRVSDRLNEIKREKAAAARTKAAEARGRIIRSRRSSARTRFTTRRRKSGDPERIEHISDEDEALQLGASITNGGEAINETGPSAAVPSQSVETNMKQELQDFAESLADDDDCSAPKNVHLEQVGCLTKVTCQTGLIGQSVENETRTRGGPNIPASVDDCVGPPTVESLPSIFEQDVESPISPLAAADPSNSFQSVHVKNCGPKENSFDGPVEEVVLSSGEAER